MKSLALQQQITQQELESKMIAAIAEFWKTWEQTPPPTCISIAEKVQPNVGFIVVPFCREVKALKR
jgi:hypothetical protein